MARVIFDRSIFHKERFDAIRASNLFKLNSQKKIEICFTTDFIEETLYFSQIDLHKFGEHWHYLKAFKHLTWFKPPEDIIPLELTGNNIFSDYYKRPNKDLIKLFENVERLIQGKVFSLDLDEMKRKTEANNRYREEFRNNVLESRGLVGETKVSFNSYFENNVEFFIKEGLMNHHKNSGKYFNVFTTTRPQCMFTEMFIKSWMAPIYLPISNHNIKVDKNDRSDSHQLSFLIWADIFISDDKQFVPKAFELLYPSPNKMLMDSRQFLEFIKSF
ncbi:MAG: hypothetical protein HYV29_13740 [Ignavibacteriales bacterium]|nr:hypothetical protein [Ignavibacteriales bacterium]